MTARDRPLVALAECTHLEAARLAADPRAVVLLPLGAIEAHGPHLPLLTDWLGAEEIARRLAPHLRRAGFVPVLAPSLPYGASPLAADWSGTVSLSVPTLVRLIVEVAGGLGRHGFRTFVLANYQADPAHLRAMALARRGLARRRLRVLFAGFSPAPAEAALMANPKISALLTSPEPEYEWHAGELETSIVLAARPDLVRRAIARRLPPARVDFRAALARGARTFREMNPKGRGYFGSPARARAETGERAMAMRIHAIARHLIAELRGTGPRTRRHPPPRGGTPPPARPSA